MTAKTFSWVLVGVLVVLVAGGGWGYYFGLNQLSAQSGQVAIRLGEAEAASARLEQLVALKHQYAQEIVPVLPLIDEALPQSKNQTEILAQLQRVAGEAGLSISAVSLPSTPSLPSATSQTVKNGAVLVLPISFQIAGSYAQLQNFLKNVEQLSRSTNVTSLTISHPDKAQPITYSITLNAYVKP